MPIKRNFSARTDLATLPEITNSLGAHLAAKLQEFASDERTLTDEFCDMTCIWASSSNASNLRTPPSGITARLEIEKVSTQREAQIGADLELIVLSPHGEQKRLLAQAKVLDPQTHKLRCDHTQGWTKLKEELEKCRNDAGDLAYLLVYVPEQELNGRRYTFGTWEQGQSSGSASSHKDSSFGATFIDVNSLLDANNDWINDPPVTYSTQTKTFTPPGIDFTSLLTNLFSCGIGAWETVPPPDTPRRDREPYRSLRVAVTEMEEASWSDQAVPFFRGFTG